MKEINASDIVTTEENEKIFFGFDVDLEADEIFDSEINPTEVEYEKVEWLYASNNKYPEDSVDHDKIGKWMLFIKPKWVDQVWGKIKSGIAKGELWNAKVTTNNPGRLHAIMIYTKDYTDLDDVIRVLNYIERTRLKPKDINIRYKADWQTRAGIYAGGKERPWIYTSETVRELATRHVSQSSNVIASLVTASPGLFSKTTAAVVSETAAVKGKSKKPPVCKFFNGASGSCNKGEACKFIHTAGKA